MDEQNVVSKSGLGEIRKNFFKNKKVLFGVLLVILMIIAGGAYFTLSDNLFSFTFKPQYLQVYSLVEDKISLSAPIKINLPEFVSKDEAPSKITFEPKIDGEWIESGLPSVVAFKPKKLEMGKRYLVALATVSGDIKKDFEVDENPSIVDIFPIAESEADESSSITIVFNRPMVPLTTLRENEKNEIPVVITPATEGKFKWISTRTLQFIPRTTLNPSSKYEVSVNKGFVSMDGLPVSGKKHNFITRPIRFVSSTNGSILYKNPIEFRFNQPVDIVKTTKEITVTDTTRNQKVDAYISYGKRSVFDYSTQKYVQSEDRRIINIVPKNDALGRANLWDYNSRYRVVVDKTYPLNGDIDFLQTIQSNVDTTDIVNVVSARSSRTSLVRQKFFDPQGQAVINFNEEIDIYASEIGATGLKSIVYDKKCEKGSSTFYNNNKPCKKVDDKTTIILSFNSDLLNTQGASLPILIRKFINTEGLEVNTKDIIVNFQIYPELKITKVTPSGSVKSDNITELTICTNSPLKSQKGKDFSNSIVSDEYMILGRWMEAYVENGYSYESKKCETGEFVNIISYGLLPNKKYNLDLKIEDVFGQKIEKKASFSTGMPKDMYMGFFSLDKIYNVTSPDKTKLSFGVQNFDKLNIHICKVSDLTMLQYLANRPSQYASGEGFPCIESKSNVLNFSPNLWVNNYFQIDIKEYFSDSRGNYILSFSNPNYRDYDRRQIFERSFISVTNLSVVQKKVEWTKYDQLPEVTEKSVNSVDGQGELYWVNRTDTLLPARGALVKVVSSVGDANLTLDVAESGTTDNLGIVRFPLIKDVAGAIIKSGTESAIVSSWADTVNSNWNRGSETKAYIYTDRPIYRPDQEVNIKGIYRVGYDADYKFDSNTPVTLTVNDSKGTAILRQNIKLTKYGTFSTTLKLPANASLGTYYITALGHNGHFEVQEYVSSAFEAKATTLKDEYVAGENVQIDLLGKYYFGVPVDGAKVSYSITAQNYYFDKFTDEYFNFGGNWYSCYGCGYGDSFIKSGQGELDANGELRISQKLDFETLFKEESQNSSKILVFHATIVDKQGKSVSTEKSFIVHRGKFYLGVKSDPYFVATNESFNLRLKTVDTDGKPTRASGIELAVNKVVWNDFKRQEVDGNYYSHYEKTLTPIFTRNVSTDGSGNYIADFKLDSAGQYEVTAVATDNLGNLIKSTGYVYVYGEGSVSVRSTDNATLTISAERQDLKVGDKAKIIFESPYKKAKALVTIERGRIFEYHVVDIDKSINEFDFTVGDKYIPNIFATVTLISPDPAVKYGQVEFKINSKEKALNVEIKSGKKSYLPGEKVDLDITTKDSSGKGVRAEVSVAVADLSVLALKGNPKKNPLIFFYDGFPLAVTTATNIKNVLHEAEIPTGTKGGGGGNAEDLAKRKRGEFKDTAFWSANIETDENGKANLTFTLPDNLTRWQVEMLGITEDTKLGVNYLDLTAQKKIMLVPLKPRFVVPGDEFQIGAQIFNQTDEPQALVVSYKSTSLPAYGSRNTNIYLLAGESRTVYFDVSAPSTQVSGKHIIELSVKNEQYEDTVQNEIPINSNTTFESVATINSTSDKTAKEFVYIPDGVLMDRGGLNIKTSATLAVFLSDGLKYLMEYPYGCSEQLASKLSSIAILKSGLSIENIGEKFKIPSVIFNGVSYTVDDIVMIALNKIYGAQTVEGGFAYYSGMKADLHLTMSIVNSLTDLENAGYKIDSDVLQSASNFIGSTLLAKGVKHYGVDTFVYGAYSMSRARKSSTMLYDVSGIIRGNLTKSFINEEASTMTLGYLALLADRENWSGSTIESIFTSLLNRVDIDSRGSYVKSNRANTSWQYYETQIKNTAILIKALSQNKREYSGTANLMSWILSSRDSVGAWGSTQNTLAVIDGFTEFLNWKQETKANFALDISLDNKKIETYDFNKSTVHSIFEKFLPIGNFSANSMHTISFEKKDKTANPNTFYYDMSLKYYLPAEKIAPRDEGITIERNLFSLLDETNQSPLITAKVGEVVKGRIKIISGKPRHLFAIEDYIPAGFEIINFSLSTEDPNSLPKNSGYGKGMGINDQPPVESALVSVKMTIMDYVLRPLRSIAYASASNLGDSYDDRRNVARELYPDFKEIHDDRLFIFKQELPAGEYTYDYYLRATTAGTFRHLPAVASELYYPENFGRTGGLLFKVTR